MAAAQTPNDQTALEAVEIHKRYGPLRVLRGVGLSASFAERVAIVGENGSGKSTLLRILAGAEAMDHGRVRCDHTIGYAPQDVTLQPHLTPDEHVDLFAAGYGIARATARARADTLFERLGFAAHRRKLVHALSGGTRQKLNLALALLHDPRVILLDEPYAGLDTDSYERFVEWLDEAKARGKCVVVVTHLLLDHDRFDVIQHLREGRLHAGDR